MISFIVPSHNEELFLAKTLAAIHATARGLEVPYEVAVVDDASTDRTGAIAQEMGTRVIEVNHHQIGGTRNSGARGAHGEQLLFVDADTTVTPAGGFIRAQAPAGRGGWRRSAHLFRRRRAVVCPDSPGLVWHLSQNRFAFGRRVFVLH